MLYFSAEGYLYTINMRKDMALDINLKFEVYDKYLKIKISQEDIYAKVNEIITAMKSFLQENNRTKMLIDITESYPPSEMEKFQIAEIGAGIFERNVKIAVLAKTSNINKFFENVAVNRGANVYVTDDEKDALEWLLK
jgi:hypothetical protein